MVHQKYTYKDGKRFGPYYYETKRVNGKIITTYLGSELPIESHDNKNYKKLIYPLAFILLIGVLLLFVFNYSPSLTGKASLDLKSSYDVGEAIDGVLRLNLKSGELIPIDSVIIVNFSGL